jgi:hypothetical protein
LLLQLKCSEERPICAQCAKARRECVPSSGITFRHQQNPSMNGDPVSRESLKNFYGYKETFGRDSIWVPVPQELTFITTNNPYDDEEGSVNPSSAIDDNLIHNGMNFGTNQAASDGDFARQLAQAAYPGYATHGLEALSAVASQDHYNYAPPPAPMTSHDPSSSVQHDPSPQQSHEAMVQSLDSLLNVHGNQPAVGSPPPNIDPQLGEMQQQMQQQPHQQHQQHPQQYQQHQQHQHQHYDDQKPIHVRTSSYNPVRPPNLHPKGTTGSSPAIREPDLAFLMRDYSEHAGAWMDLFDLGQFFATEVPLLAIDCPLLLYSCAALSAKSLSRITISDIVSDIPSPPQRHSRLASRPGAPLDAEGWVQKGRENYDLAVSLLRQALAGGSTPLRSSALPDTSADQTASIAQDAPLPDTGSDELVAATAILCVYEFLDASGPEWSRHLDGAKSLFEVAKESMVPLSLEPEPVSLANQIRDRLAGHTMEPGAAVRRREPSKGRTAVFWNFARQDMLSAFINNTGTRLDVGDLPMWTSAGINLDPQGYICPTNPSHPEYRSATAMSDDKISNALIWLLMKLVNFIAAGDEMPASMLGVRQHDLLAYWHEMDKQLHIWHDGLPPSFRAIAVGIDEASGLEERWFPRPMCASAMQMYHFTRVQLLMNKPHISTGSPFPRRPPFAETSNNNITGHGDTNSTPGSSLAARHASYAIILQQCRFHAKEIVAISLGRADEGARIHSVQPLWTAGLLLGARGVNGISDDTELWRRTIVDLLRGIERDMGWACEHRVQDLLSVWEAEG